MNNDKKIDSYKVMLSYDEEFFYIRLATYDSEGRQLTENLMLQIDFNVICDVELLHDGTDRVDILEAWCLQYAEKLIAGILSRRH